MSQNGDDIPISRENAAVVDVVGAEEYVEMVASSTPVRTNAGFESEGFTFREAVKHAFVQESGGVVFTFWPTFILVFVSSSLCFIFSYVDSHTGHNVNLYKLVMSVWTVF